MQRRYETRRNLLHRTKLSAFLSWAETQGYVQHPRPEKSAYEVARLEKADRAGNNPHIVIYAKHTGDHLTTFGEGTDLVRRWIEAGRRALAHATTAHGEPK